MGAETFLANDDIATRVDVLCGPSPCLPAFGRRVPLFNVVLVLRERVAQASGSARVTLALTGGGAVSIPIGPCPTDVIRSLRPSCMSNR